MNYKLLIQYDGTDFHGWQMQARGRTVQGDLTNVLTALTGEKVNVIGSGRTDAGVHAEGQVASVKLEKEFEPLRLRAALNGNLNFDVRIVSVEEAAANFHARFSAKGKTYLYRVVNAPFVSPFDRRFALHEGRALDVLKMQEAAQMFLGEHDWTAFSAARADADSRIRTISRLDVEARYDARTNGTIVEFTFAANGFLRYMVRSIVGTLLEVGRGYKSLETVERAIATGERKLAGKTADAKGLTLLKVDYD